MKNKSLKNKLLATLVAAATFASTAMATVSAADISWVSGGDISKVSQITTPKAEYALEVNRPVDFSKEVSVYESADRLITNHSYIEYSLTGSTADFTISGSTVTARRAGAEATLIVYDDYSKKAKLSVKLKSIMGNSQEYASGFNFANSYRSEIVYDSATGKNTSGKVTEVEAFPAGSVFTQKDKETIGKSIAPKLDKVLGLDTIGSLDNINSSFKIEFKAANLPIKLDSGATPTMAITSSLTVQGKAASAELTKVEDIVALYDDVEFKIGRVTWVMNQALPADTFVTVTPKAIPANYVDLSKADREKNNCEDDIRKLTAPVAVSDAVGNVTENVLTFDLNDIKIPVTAAADSVKFRFKGEGTVSMDSSVIEFYVDNPNCFSKEYRENSLMAANKAVAFESDALYMEYSYNRQVKAVTNFVAVDAVTATAMMLPNEVRVKVGKKVQVKPTFYPTNANIIGNITYLPENSGDTYAAIEQDGKNATIYGVATTGKSGAAFIASMDGVATTHAYVKVIVEPQNFKEQKPDKPATAPKFDKTKLEMQVGDIATVKVSDIADDITDSGKIKWTVSNGSVELKLTEGTANVLVAKKAGTALITATLTDGTRLECTVVVKDVPKQPEKEDPSKGTNVPQTGDTLFANLW